MSACVPSIVYSQTLVGETSTFDYTTIFSTPSAGLYRVSIGLFVAGSGADVGSVSGQYAWGNPDLNNIGSFGGSSLYPGSQVLSFRTGESISLQWEVTALTNVDHYDLSIVVEQLLDS